MAEITVSARGRQEQHSARTTMIGVIRKLKLCPPGQLTHAPYRAKLPALRDAIAAGELTQAQLGRYDAARVTCLKVIRR